ncbi:hypothetical protein E2C01_020037 [Portunus trituberculatus]|uniref:Uncharacterized protein n=1 Tax=Portunus trituberculatus TaxID=210409 RepID=A0A5B7E113_PORTR|nr:hypothetical protein [Portunus trituberculatus]
MWSRPLPPRHPAAPANTATTQRKNIQAAPTVNFLAGFTRPSQPLGRESQQGGTARTNTEQLVENSARLAC